MTDRPKRPAPKSVRYAPEERVVLASRAARYGLSEHAYIIWRTVHNDAPPPRSRGLTPIRDHQAISAVLAKLANSHMAGNLNQLAKAANSGSLVLTPDVDAALRQAAADIAMMGDLLVKALGLSNAS